jgi:DNA-binding beta-propeller fold protein YncE
MDRTITSGLRRVSRAASLALLAAVTTAILAQGQVRVKTLVGTGQAGRTDGDARTGQLNRPHRLAVDAQGNVYVSDRGSHAIRVVATNGAIRTLAGGREGNAHGASAAASFRQPIAVAVDRSGTVYVADRADTRRRVRS